VLAAQPSREFELCFIAQNHSGALAARISGRQKENPIAEILFQFSHFAGSQCKAEPYIPALLFK